MIDGLLLTPLPIVRNPKGDIYHALKATAPGYEGFGEVYFSIVNKGLTKGWNQHKRLTLNLVVPVGEIRFFIYDDRANSSTNGKYADICIGLTSDYSRLTVPKGLWVAFQGLSDFNLLMNIIDEEHDPDEVVKIELEEIPCPDILSL